MAVVVRKVFAENLKEEISIIQNTIIYYPFLAIDTEFPGTVFKVDKATVRLEDPNINYEFMKANLDCLKIIQLGLTLADSKGNLPNLGTCFSYIWEFNFKDFDMENDCYDSESIKLLEKQGIDFEKNREFGIDSRIFSTMIWSLGIFDYFRNANWITFHGAYDIGFMLKILSQRPLPDTFDSFMEDLVLRFGYKIFDIKHAFRFLELHGGLEKVAQALHVKRIAGSSHQAGSDSLLTLQCFMRLLKAGAFQHNRRTRILPPLKLFGLNPVPISTMTLTNCIYR